MRQLFDHVGSKWRLAPIIAPLFVKAETYVEPFFGSGAVFFALRPQPRRCILNDTNDHVVNLFRVLRFDADELARMIELTPYARREMEQAAAVLANPEQNDSITKAWAFLVMSWLTKAQAWQTSASHVLEYERRPSNWKTIPSRIRETAAALRNDVIVEHRDALEVIAAFDAPTSWLYADPPYLNAEVSYKDHADESFHAVLIKALLSFRGKVVLSCYDHEVYQPLVAAGWQVRHIPNQSKRFSVKSATETLYLNPAIAAYGVQTTMW